ncbi:MAG TPA: hypothetical protein VFS10_05480 [Pyrinomonadaceae bacterium]|nr:hypothetical protein [Pyrinomonadaceae bacterium]
MATTKVAADTKPQEPVGATDETPAPTPAVKRKLTQLETGDKVSYVVNRGYVAGEAPDITEATVAKIHDQRAGVVDLQVEGDEEKKTSVRYSERHEPHTWHFA